MWRSAPTQTLSHGTDGSVFCSLVVSPFALSREGGALCFPPFFPLPSHFDTILSKEKVSFSEFYKMSMSLWNLEII